MFRLLLVFVVAALAIALVLHYRSLPLEKRKSLLWRLALIAAFIFLVLLTVTGRLHWVGTVIGTAILFIKDIGRFLLYLLPFLSRKKATPETDHTQEAKEPAPTSGNMGVDEALKTLGLNIKKLDDISQEHVIEAHRKLMQKMHPDRGGNDYLASKINQAKDILLRHLTIDKKSDKH